MSRMLTLLTVHKGVDLHAATAERVLRERLEGGSRLVALRRAELHLLWGADDRPDLAARGRALLESGRHYNPNKHRYGIFELAAAGDPWPAAPRRGDPLPAGWPGEPLLCDRGPVGPDLLDRLLGGEPPEGTAAVDVCAYPLGEAEEPLAAVLWRLVLNGEPASAAAAADLLAVARGGGRGLLVNPHMQGWLLAPRPDARAGAGPEGAR